MKKSYVSEILVDSTTTMSQGGGASAGTIALNIHSSFEEYIVYTSASKTLAGNLAITASGTPQRGTVVNILYDADVILNGNSFSFFGVSIPEHLSAKTMLIKAVYGGTGKWAVAFMPDFVGTAVVDLADLSFAISGTLYNYTGTGVATSGTAIETLASYTVPADTLTQAQDVLDVEAQCTVAANANAKVLTVTLNGRTLHVSTYSNPNGLTATLKLKVVYVTSTTGNVIGQLVWSDGTVEAITVTPQTLFDFTATQSLLFRGTTAASSGDLTMVDAMAAVRIKTT